MSKLEHSEQNITKAYQSMPAGEMQDLSQKLERHKMAMDLFFHNHIDA